jgi:hypothetical protein
MTNNTTAGYCFNKGNRVYSVSRKAQQGNYERASGVGQALAGI